MTASTWRARSAQRLHWCDWGADAVVFDEASGRTHQLSALTAAVLAQLEDTPASRTAVVGALALALGVPADDADLGAAVDQALDQLRDHGWIEPA